MRALADRPLVGLEPVAILAGFGRPQAGQRKDEALVVELPDLRIAQRLPLRGAELSERTISENITRPLTSS